MPSDYKAIRRDNELRYGTDIGRIGPMLLADRYDDRTHFIYELLQNAEDALSRRVDWSGSRAVCFDFNRQRLKVSHYGKPFDKDDVAGVCGIGESTKDLTAIGRFGIGFKSVYAFNDRPEIHSGSEDFAIESYVWPIAVTPVDREEEETVILIPLKPDDGEGVAEIVDGLSRPGASSLLFLREIEEIRWSVDGVLKGTYRQQAVDRGRNVRAVTVVGQEDGEPEVDEEWLVFSREVHAGDGRSVGHVEVAWSVTRDDDGNVTIRPVERSQLVVYFPTVVETGLGFVVQGPYRTTPSRDNVPPRDDWNRKCVRETGTLLVESLRWLRDEKLLDATALTCLPLNNDRFEGSMFQELFEVTKDALSRENLLPAHGGGYVSAEDGRLARTQELRDLLEPVQLGALERRRGRLRWVDGQISVAKTHLLRRYLIQELGMRELTPEALLPELSGEFLEDQDDHWIQRLYEFLGPQRALRPQLGSLPIIRLANGSHVPPSVDGEPQAFLPGSVETDFPTIRKTVCCSEGALEFLRSLNLTEPDPVDNVIRNVLPKYRKVGKVEECVSESDYTSDIEHMLTAAATDSQSQKDKLVKKLRSTPWVKAVDAGGGLEVIMATPEDVYVATERLRELFAGIKGVLIVDSRIACLRGEKIRELLERSGASRYLQPVKVKCNLSPEQLHEIRWGAGLERSTWDNEIKDVGIRGLAMLLEKLPVLESKERVRRAANLWDALCDLHERGGPGTFEGTYKWSYSHEKKVAKFDAAFVRVLNEKRWIPDSSGTLREPVSITFDEVGWRPNGFLQSKISFKSPFVEQLAQKAGIESGVLDFLLQRGITSEAELRRRLGPEDEPSNDELTPSKEKKMPSESKFKPCARDVDEEKMSSRLQFISYVGVVGEGANSDPDGLEHTKRMELEDSAIKFILDSEPDWQPTPTNNPGFDLYRGTAMDAATKWCEVKAMTGTLRDRPVGMSRVQFEWAREHGEAYWLYIVEHAGSKDARIVRIQDPAGKAMTFTFDNGWRAAAVVDTSPKDHS